MTVLKRDVLIMPIGLGVITLFLIAFLILQYDKGIDSNLIITLSIFGALLIYYLLKKKLILVAVENEDLIFNISTFFTTQKITCPKEEISYSFKREVGARGIKQMTLRVYQNDSYFIELVPFVDGWSTAQINKLGNLIENKRVSD